MKNLLRLALFAVAPLTSSYAVLAIGDGAELFLTGTLGVRADDNIYLAQNGESDLIFDINPGVDLTFGKNAQVRGSLTLIEHFANYSDNSDLNSNLFTGDFLSRFDDGKLKLQLGVSFHELNQNVYDIRPVFGSTFGNIRRDLFTLSAGSEVEISQITSVGVAVKFEDENYKRSDYADAESLTVPLDVFYRWTPKTDVSLGYRYRDTRVNIGQDATDHFFNVGARGEFSPKLKGRFAVGYNTRKLQGGDTETQLGLDARFNFELTPKTGLEFGASNDFGTGPRGQQEKNLVLDVGAKARIAEEWGANANLSWRSIDYGTRTDDYYEVQLGTSYIVNASVRIVGAYVFRDYSSGIKPLEFRNNVFSISANFRY